MSYVFDSSSLIYLGKLKILEKIKEKEKLIPSEVYKEVITKGIERKEPEANYIKNLIEKGIFRVKKTEGSIINTALLSKADMEVLSLAKETNSIAVIDENYAKEIVMSLKIKSHGSIYIILNLLKENTVTKRQAIEYLGKMIDLGFYLSTQKYKEILKIIKKI